MDLKVLATNGVNTVKKYSPEILLGTTIAFSVAGLGYALWKSQKGAHVVESTKWELNYIREGNYPDKKTKAKALIGEYGNAAWRLIKVYHPTIIFETLAIASVVGMYSIMKARTMALSAAAASTLAAFNAYRDKVKERYGEDVDAEFAYGESKTKVPSKDDPKKKETIKVSSGLNSPYAIYFDDHSSYLCENHSVDDWRFMLDGTQTFINSKLVSNKLVTIHDVLMELNYDMDVLTEEQKKMSLVCGWRKGEGDDCVILTTRQSTRQLPTGEIIPTLIVDFNVIGGVI